MATSPVRPLVAPAERGDAPGYGEQRPGKAAGGSGMESDSCWENTVAFFLNPLLGNFSLKSVWRGSEQFFMSLNTGDSSGEKHRGLGLAQDSSKHLPRQNLL